MKKLLNEVKCQGTRNNEQIAAAKELILILVALRGVAYVKDDAEDDQMI